MKANMFLCLIRRHVVVMERKIKVELQESVALRSGKQLATPPDKSLGGTEPDLKM